MDNQQFDPTMSKEGMIRGIVNPDGSFTRVYRLKNVPSDEGGIRAIRNPDWQDAERFNVGFEGDDNSTQILYRLDGTEACRYSPSIGMKKPRPLRRPGFVDH